MKPFRVFLEHPTYICVTYANSEVVDLTDIVWILSLCLVQMHLSWRCNIFVCFKLDASYLLLSLFNLTICERQKRGLTCASVLSDFEIRCLQVDNLLS